MNVQFVPDPANQMRVLDDPAMASKPLLVSTFPQAIRGAI
jgi:hypothetical protein